MSGVCAHTALHMCHGEGREAMHPILPIRTLGVWWLRDIILNTSVLFYSLATSIVPFVIKNNKRQPKKKSSYKSGVTTCRTMWGAFVRDRLASFCRRLGVKGWQDLNGRPRSSKSHGKSRLKGNFKVIRFSTLSLFSPSTIFPVNKSPVYAPVPLSTHPTLAGTPSGPNVWCASHICAPKKLGLYPAIGNGKL